MRVGLGAVWCFIRILMGAEKQQFKWLMLMALLEFGESVEIGSDSARILIDRERP